MIGQTISHYRIVERIGGGGMGVVYKAEDTRLKRIVALKFLPPELTRDEEAKRRFVHEAQAASALDHPNICNIHEVAETADGQTFIVMGCYEGQTLKKKIESGQLEINEVVDIAMQVAQGLSKAHEKEIVHRDIKPANVMLTTDGVAKIVDFGLAKLSGRTLLTKSGTTIGTAAYMSPEQARGEQVDQRSDIWSLGVVLYEMITGKRPFESEYEQALVYSIISEDPKPIRNLRPEVPEPLEKICRRAMAKDAMERYQTAAELIADLDSYKAGIQLSKPTRRLRTNRERLILAGALAVSLAVLCGAVYFLFPSSEPIDSIAVLPFENLSGDSEQEYFSEGMTIAIIDELTKIKSLRPISWQSVKKFRKTDKSISEIAGQLGVKAVVSAQVMRDRENVTISASLIQASPEKTLWSKRFAKTMTNILVLQSELAKSIVREINLVTTPQEAKLLERTQPVKPDAYEAYLKAGYFRRQWTEDALRKAVTYYQRAIEIDSTFADAYAGLGGAYSFTAIQCYQPLNELFPRAKNAFLKALELDESSVRAHAELGMLMLLDWNWSAAENEYQRGLSLNPNHAAALFSYGIHLIIMGRYDEAVSVTKRALEQDPLIPTHNLQLGWVLYYARRHDESIVQLKKTLEMAPNLGWPNMQLAWNYAQKRMYPEAVAECKRALELCPEDQVVLSGSGFVYGLAGKRSEALKCLAQLTRLSKRRYIDPYNIAWIYGGLGDNDRTMEWLERGYKEHSVSMYGVRTETWRDELRSDPRFQDLLRRMNFPQ